MSYISVYYHIIIHTKPKTYPLTKHIRNEISTLIAGKCHQINAKLMMVNGIENHLHLLISMHQSSSISVMVQKIKLATSLFIRERFPTCGFQGWSNGYACISFSYRELPRLKHYVQNQEQHHKKQSPKDELLAILHDHQIEFNPEYLPELDD